jgi:hypothetical protein
MIMNKLNKTLASVLAIVLLSFYACKKDDSGSGDYTVKFLQQYNDNEIPRDTTFVASDLSFSCRALVSPAGDVSNVRYSVYYDATEVVYYDYPVNTTNDSAYLLDPVTFDFDYDALAGMVQTVYLQVKATDKAGNSKTSRLSFRIQPVNFPFQFRFYDFKSSDTLPAGAQVNILPFFSPLIASQQIDTMKVFLKAGFGKEKLVDTFTAGDFYYYQTGYLREYSYTVPANAVSGSGILHRFELSTSDGKHHVIQHGIIVE